MLDLILICLVTFNCTITLLNCQLQDPFIIHTQTLCQKIFSGLAHVDHHQTEELRAIREMLIKMHALQKNK